MQTLLIIKASRELYNEQAVQFVIYIQ